MPSIIIVNLLSTCYFSSSGEADISEILRWLKLDDSPPSRCLGSLNSGAISLASHRDVYWRELEAVTPLPLQAMVAAAGSTKDYTLKSYLAFADKLREKAHELSKSGETMENFTPSDVERALWSTAAASMPRKTSKSATAGASATTKSVKRKRGT